MTRSTILAIPAAFALVAGCGPPAADNAVDNAMALNATTTIEDVPSDSLAAPEGEALPSETASNTH
jgi:hypothetical protein